MDERVFLDTHFPPDPTVLSDADPARTAVRHHRHSSTQSQSLSDHLSNGLLSLPPPPHAAADLPFISKPGTDTLSPNPTITPLQLSAESTEDVNIGAIVLGRRRLKNVRIAPIDRTPPIPWRLYSSHQSAHDVWAVLQEYLTNLSLKSHGRTRALQLLTGYVIGACLESTDTGIAMLTKIVRRMRGAERSERDGSIFTLLINVAAHVSFVQRVSWHSVEQVVRKVFSEVVEQMHGCQDDKVMWERALRCFLILLKASDHQPSSDLSTKALVALALHIGDLTHADIDHVLITNGLCARLRTNDDTVTIDLDTAVLEQAGGVSTICTLFADTTSTSARHSLFSVLFDVAVVDTLDSMSLDDAHALVDHVRTFRSLLAAYDSADLFVHSFRVGPTSSFVMDAVRLFLLKPLAMELGNGDVDSPEGVLAAPNRPSFHEGNGSTHEFQHHLFDAAHQASVSKHISSIRTMVQFLDRPFCLKVLQRIQRMAEHQAIELSRRENMHHSREWKLFLQVESLIQSYIFSSASSESISLDDLLTKIYSATVDMTLGRTNLRGIVKMAELLLEFFTMKMPFSKRKQAFHYDKCTDSVAKLFLSGQLVVSRDLLELSNPDIFTELLHASRQRVPLKRVSECRQCLVEFLGVSKDKVPLLRDFTDDDDAAVAYRSSEIVSKYLDLLPRSRSLTGGDGEEDM